MLASSAHIRDHLEAAEAPRVPLFGQIAVPVSAIDRHAPVKHFQGVGNAAPLPRTWEQRRRSRRQRRWARQIVQLKVEVKVQVEVEAEAEAKEVQAEV